jgi:hypothetical protein
MITLRNDLHNTSIVVNETKPLTRKKIMRWRKALCGVADCQCGGWCGEHGPQEPRGGPHVVLRLQVAHFMLSDR